MKGKSKSIISVLLAALLLTSLAAGCADRGKVPIVSGTGECPEGYVYDYQVSMEPIPEEIAALGGPCEGTIHAFPSRIGMALTELEMEKDPVLKAEVEKRIPEIEAALEEEIGGEFVVDGVILFDELAWVFFCTEVETGYQFDLYYGNKEYYAYLQNRNSSENIISVDYYYDEKESKTLRNVLLPIIQKIYVNGDIKVQWKNEGDEVIIAIAQYEDCTVDKCAEQEKLLQLWDKLQSYDNTLTYNINITYYPSQYKDVINEKYTTMLYYDFGRVCSDEFLTCLVEKGEIWCSLDYAESWDEGDAYNLDILLQEYKEGNYKQDEIWEYWIP